MNAPRRGTVLWWGRGDNEYSRNRVLRACLEAAGWEIRMFRPAVSRLGHLEAAFRQPGPADLVWVPCFRQRDVLAASRWARRRRVPLVFDPLISAYDKQVFERARLVPGGDRAVRLLAREREGFGSADAVLADTHAHASFFREVLGVSPERVHVVPVGAEEGLFEPHGAPPAEAPREVLFFGSYVPLQGAKVIVEAARCYRGPPVRWHLVGDGALRSECEAAAADLPQVRFSDWVPYDALPRVIAGASLVLGVFGETPKAARVIPNKVYQALACGRPVITRRGEAYPPDLLAAQGDGLRWVPPGDAVALAEQVATFAALDEEALAAAGRAARRTYEDCFSSARICAALAGALEAVSPAAATP